MDSVREDGEIGALRDMHAEEVDYDRWAQDSWEAAPQLASA